eukprot:TRINITY_DN81_c2_g1_i1.p1 TRINITY_DN81_c2_g1~~TRINITY_DN81_c2_g1_i1.p1  ORF type:complete len:708 (+),score=218.77 TRINITY_DN81_c2_g1_i1:83-2206(+)
MGSMDADDAQPVRFSLNCGVRPSRKFSFENGWELCPANEGTVTAIDVDGDLYITNPDGDVSPEPLPASDFVPVTPAVQTRPEGTVMQPGCVVTPTRELQSSNGWTLHLGEEGTVASLDTDGDPFVVNAEGHLSPEAYWSSDFRIVRYASSLLSPERVPPSAPRTADPPRPYRRGELVQVFYRTSEVQFESWLRCPTSAAGLLTPRIGVTDGWVPAQVLQDFDPARYDPSNVADTGILLKLEGGFWFSRRGCFCDEGRLQGRVVPERVQSNPAAPRLSLVVVRWGGDRSCDPVHHGDGGWGRTGSNVSDPYIRTVFDEAVWPQLGTTYECITVFVGGSGDLERVCPRSVSQQLRGRHKCGMYFLWPCNYQDCPDSPGYVPQTALLRTMAGFEQVGVHTRFPHNSHLYRLLLSKDWMSHLCMDRSFCCPATTKVSRAVVADSPIRAARQALLALRMLRKAAARPQPHQRQQDMGVVKLGFSWEAVDVKRWKGERELAEALRSLAEQPLSTGASAMVQDYVDFDFEMRQFFVEPQPGWDEVGDCPKFVTPTKTLYTRFAAVESGKFTEFQRMDRQTCVDDMLFGDGEAMAQAERKAAEIASRVLLWLQAESAEPVPVIRVDTMVRRSAQGCVDVTLGEITELGGCFLGWPAGPSVVFNAVVRSCFRNTGPGGLVSKVPEPPAPEAACASIRGAVLQKVCPGTATQGAQLP